MGLKQTYKALSELFGPDKVRIELDGIVESMSKPVPYICYGCDEERNDMVFDVICENASVYPLTKEIEHDKIFERINQQIYDFCGVKFPNASPDQS